MEKQRFKITVRFHVCLFDQGFVHFHRLLKTYHCAIVGLYTYVLTDCYAATSAADRIHAV